MLKNLRLLETKLGKKLKKPICAYSLFVKQRRQTIQLEHAELDHIGVMKTLSLEWKKLDESVRKDYEEKAELDK